MRSHNKVRALFAENKVRFAHVEQLWSNLLKQKMWTAAFRYNWKRLRQQHKIQVDGLKLPVAYAPLVVKRYQSSQSQSVT